MSLVALIKRLRDVMRKDSGVDGDAQRLQQIVWLIFLKVLMIIHLTHLIFSNKFQFLI